MVWGVVCMGVVTLAPRGATNIVWFSGVDARRIEVILSGKYLNVVLCAKNHSCGGG